MIKIIQFFSILLLSSHSWAYRPGTLDTSNFNECLWTKKAIKSFVDCNDLFHHYKPERSRYSPITNSVRLGAFNIFRLSEQRKNKNFDWMTELIESEWDIVALSELQTSNATLQKANGKLVEQLDDGFISRSQFSKKYTLPAHVFLLKELQKKDSSWGLILSPFTQGSDSELFGFLYRGNQVKIQESKYCKAHYNENNPWPETGFIYRETGKNGFSSNKDGTPVNNREFVHPKKTIACPLALSGINLEQFPKVPLTARFRSGDFEFNYISLHLSFGSFGEFYKKCLGRCQLNALRLVSTFSDSDDNQIFNYITEYMEENSQMIAEQEITRPSDCDSECRDRYKKDQEKREAKIMSSVYQTITKIAEDDSIFSDIVLPVFNKINKENKNARPKISKEEGREINRFFQTKAVMSAANEITSHENNNDVIIAGDFNVDITKEGLWQKLLWDNALSKLQNADILITEKTSISFSKKNQNVEYVSNYDHFVLVNSRGATDECDPESATRVDFINEFFELSNGFNLGDKIHNHKDDTLKKEVRYEHPLSDHVPITMTCSIKN